jgi:arginyl-tRNA synthetase
MNKESLSLTIWLSQIFSEAFDKCGLDPAHGIVVPSNRPDLSQFQCNGALAAAKASKRNPRVLAQEVIDAISSKEDFSDISVAGAGFINVSLTDAFLAQHLADLESSARLGYGHGSSRHVVIDFCGPNVAKPMHVGHLRSTIIGDCLQRLFRFVGDQVTSDIHMGDWGLQMGMLIRECERQMPGFPYFAPDYIGTFPSASPVTIDDLQEMYPRAAQRCKESDAELGLAQRATKELQQGRPGYRALWQHFVDVSFAAVKEDIGRLGVTFDLWRGESYTNDDLPSLITDLRARGLAIESDGAIIVPVSRADESASIPPMILVNSEGGQLYAATDLATIRDRVDEMKADSILYVVDKRQQLHFEQVFHVAKLASYAGDAELEHIPFGTMNGSDGKPFKTREGGVMRLSKLMDMIKEKVSSRMAEGNIAAELDPAERNQIAEQVGIATLKFADLSNHRTTDYIFDLDLFSQFEGKTGPYLLYSAVRIKSILRKAQMRNLAPGTYVPPVSNVERNLWIALLRFPDAVEKAYVERAPNYLCEFGYDLARAFSRFYMDCHILGTTDPMVQGSWLRLCSLCLHELTTTLELLGIEIPDRM